MKHHSRFRDLGIAVGSRDAMMVEFEPSAEPAALAPQQVVREFHRLIDSGAPIRCAGDARDDPESLLSSGYTPKYRVDLFDTRFYLTNVRQNPDIRFFVAYVVQENHRTGGTEIFPRIFYKDISLIWRSASHFIRSDDENWIGKGEMRTYVIDGEEIEQSAEETTDLPLEIQTALEALNRKARRVPHDEVAIALVLRRGHDDRIEPYRDFVEPRERARSDPRNLINRGRSIAHFSRKKDPTSLRFAKGFEPDFDGGVVEFGTSKSKLYGGCLQRFRILSKNRKIQYLFFAGPHSAWIIPPQTTAGNLTSYGVRAIDVIADEDLCIPGYEYHFMDHSEDPPVLVSQIPEGFVGATNGFDPTRADASGWIERLPVIQEFRRKLLKGSRNRSVSR
ncbi:MAG: hypothetical protein JRE43_03075 [Deltaproteobacteria bacterium]|nr:hypothetical protein [Deltaproteobacteria bacterium]